MVRDRHARAQRADGDPKRRPADGFRAATERRFERLLDDALSALPNALREAVHDADVQVVDVPPGAALERAAIDGEVPLAAFTPGRRGRAAVRPQLEVYRRPLELRGTSRGDLLEVLRMAVGSEIARATGLPDDELFDDDEDGSW